MEWSAYPPKCSLPAMCALRFNDSLVCASLVTSITLAVMAAVYSIKDRGEVGAAVGAGGLFVKRFKLPAKLLLQVIRLCDSM